MKFRNSTLNFYYVIPLILLFSWLISCSKEQDNIKIDLTDPQYATLIGGAFYIYDKTIVICPPDSEYVFEYHAAIRNCPYCGVDAIAGVNSKYEGFLFACSNCSSFWTSSGTLFKTSSDFIKPLSLTVYPCSVSGHTLTIKQ